MKIEKIIVELATRTKIIYPIRKVRNCVNEYKKSKIDIANFGGIENITPDEANKFFEEKIREGKPFSVIRMGYAELDIFYQYERKKSNSLYKYSGPMYTIFGKDEKAVENYIELLKEAYCSADGIVNWYSCKNEGKLIEKYAGCLYGMPSRVLSPFLLEKPWTKALTGKRVLIVSPFDATIKKQYEKREKIYPNGLLPEFEIKTVKSVWYAGEAGNDCRFQSWFEALDYLKKEIDQQEFDIALLGCGPFGVPLVSYIKNKGKQAIYMGGSLQLVFGIRGARWDTIPIISSLYNEYWVSPNKADRPAHPEKIDDGCYW